MKQQSPRPARINRRNWLALAASALAGCGGGGVVVFLPGTGGTGIYAQGAIAGFGSVIVNGIKFDDRAASVQIDGTAAGSQDLRLGMVAAVQGSSGTDPGLGVADRIEVWSIAQGTIRQVQGGVMVVAGMTIQTSSATVFESVASAAALAAGQTVAVWGLQAGADGSRWVATRVALLTAAPTRVVSSGLVAGSASQRSLNGIVLRGAVASGMPAGQLVRAQGVLSDGALQVEDYRVLALPPAAGPAHQVEVEGVVTQVLSLSRFMLGNIEVDTGAAPNPAIVSVGLRMQVRGTLQGQLLRANALQSESEQELDRAEIEGPIQQYAGLANFVVRGQRCDAGAAAITRGKASDLGVGVKVKVEGTKAGDVLRVSRLEIGD